MTSDDIDLEDYISWASEDAFRKIVERHSGLVRGVALRVARDAALAEEITQSVFIVLSRKAASIPTRNLSGWLYNTAVGEARNAVRKTMRRDRINREYMNEIKGNESRKAAWEEISPILDEAVAELPKDEKRLVVMRFFEQLDYREISKGMGCSEQACRKRSERALDRLAEILGRKGFRTSSGVLASGLAAFALLPAPASAALISSAALAAAMATPPSTTFLTFLKIMTTKQAIAVTTGVLALAAVPLAVKLKKGENTIVTPTPQVSKTTPASRGAEGRGPEPRALPVAKTGIPWGSLFRKLDAIAPARQDAEIQALIQRFDAMSTDELLTAVQNVEKTTEGEATTRMEIKEILSRVLASRDPMLILDMMTDGEDFDLSLSGYYAFQELVRKDPEAAQRWLDEKISSGFKFPGESDAKKVVTRDLFQGSLVSAIRALDPMRAIQRVMAVPPDERANLLMMSNDLDYNSSLINALDYETATGDGSLVSDMVTGEFMERLGYAKDPVEMAKARETFERIKDLDLQKKAFERLDEVSVMTFDSVRLDLLTK